MACPTTLVIAGTHSGTGKTSLTLAMARALTRRGIAVQTFKVGPDFLDPTYLALASGRPCYALDGWMAGKDHVRRLFKRATADADVALIEGVMGLFDGADPATSEGSTAEIARWLDAPIILVVSVHGMARSLAAVVKGFTVFEAGLRFAGIVANNCGSERHATWLAESLRSAALPPLIGALPRGGFPELASRHLGLVTADKRLLPEALLDTMANALERHLAIERLFPELAAGQLRQPKSSPDRLRTNKTKQEAHAEASGSGRPLQMATPSPLFPRKRAGTAEEASLGEQEKLRRQDALFYRFVARKKSAGKRSRKVSPARLKIGVALDAAFHFYYGALFDALDRAGCEIVPFSPLLDRRLPEGISGLYLGGGYPEAHAAALAANREMLLSIREYAATGQPLYAECGGLMYLSEGLQVDGHFHPFLGILPAQTRMLNVRRALGYVEVILGENSLWGRQGDVFRGHEFHYSELVGDPTACPTWRTVYALRRRRSDAVEAEGFQSGKVLASYAHLYYASKPAAVDHFIDRCGG